MFLLVYRWHVFSVSVLRLCLWRLRSYVHPSALTLPADAVRCPVRKWHARCVVVRGRLGWRVGRERVGILWVMIGLAEVARARGRPTWKEGSTWPHGLLTVTKEQDVTSTTPAYKPVREARIHLYSNLRWDACRHDNARCRAPRWWEIPAWVFV